MKKIQQKPKDEQAVDILKRLSKRIEEATVDIHSIKFDVKVMKLDMMGIKSDSAIMKVDIEKIREELEELGTRLDKRITNIADLITIEFGGKLQNHEKRIKKLEHIQQTS